MKNYIITFLMIFLVRLASGQDTIVKTNGGEIIKPVTKITLTEVEYQLAPNTYMSILKSNVAMIKYANGSIQVFNKTDFTPADSSLSAATDENAICNQAIMDARLYYRGNTQFWNNFISTVGCGPFFGLAVAIPSSLTKPRTNNLNIPYNKYSELPAYRNCYVNEAAKIKRRKVWEGFGAGIGIYAVYIATIYALLN